MCKITSWSACHCLHVLVCAILVMELTIKIIDNKNIYCVNTMLF